MATCLLGANIRFFFNSASVLHKKHTFLCSTAFEMHKITVYGNY